MSRCVTEGEGTRVYRGERILIAVGTKPHRPADVPFDGRSVLDSDEIVEIDHLPRSLTVIGAGVIGIEYATIFSALDVAVTLVGRARDLSRFHRPRADRRFHPPAARPRHDASASAPRSPAIEFENGRPVTVLESGRRIRSEMLLYAAGRMGATEPLNLGCCGLETDCARPAESRSAHVPDRRCRTSIPPATRSAFPAWPRPRWSRAASPPATRSACQLPPAPEFFPYGIYAVPEISTVGMSEQEVRKRGIPYECGIARFRETSRGHIMGLNTGMMKMIFSLKTGRLLGVHIVGEGATELVHIGQAVLNLKGTLDYFIENTFNYPTLAEAYKIAALDAWNRMARV